MKNPIDKLSDKLTKYLINTGTEKFKAKVLSETVIYTSAIIIMVVLVYGILILN